MIQVFNISKNLELI